MGENSIEIDFEGHLGDLSSMSIRVAEFSKNNQDNSKKLKTAAAYDHPKVTQKFESHCFFSWAILIFCLGG